MAINHGGKMGPAILPTRNMRHVHRPPFITAAGSADPAVHARPRGTRPLMHQPPLLLQHPIHRLLVHDDAPSGHARVPRDADSRTSDAAESTAGVARPRAGSGLPGAVATLPTRCNRARPTAKTRQLRRSETPDNARSHASDVFRSKG